MFRITKDPHMNIWYIHKKFLWWWVKWGTPKTNLVSNINNIPKMMKMGSYNFNLGECGNYYFIVERTKPKIEYFKNVDEFNQEYAEFLI